MFIISLLGHKLYTEVQKSGTDKYSHSLYINIFISINNGSNNIYIA